MRAKLRRSSPCYNSCYINLSGIFLRINTSQTIVEVKRTHALLLKFLNKPRLHHLLDQLLGRLLRVPGDNLSYACHLFDEIPNCENQYTWTALIRYHVIHGQLSSSILVFAKMLRAGVLPSGFTFSSVLNACARIPKVIEGKQVHAKAVQLGSLGNRIVQTTLLDLYAKCGLLQDACNVFVAIDDKDVVAWTAMICGYTKMGMMDEAQRLFDAMEQHNLISWTTMVAGYAHRGDMQSAKVLYDKMPERTAVSSVAMIAGYGKCGDVTGARKIFTEISVQEPLCWAAMVACYAQNGYAEEAMEMYNKMREESVLVTEVALVGAISACTQLGDVEMARTLAEHVDMGSFDRTLVVSNALMHMHSKCGSIGQACAEFNRMRDRDVISYSTLITALAEHGKTREALNLFSEMQEKGIRPNQFTFTGVLNACSHGGLIEEGCGYFEQMTEGFGIEPLKEHYACMIDLLGRAGQVAAAYNLLINNVQAADAKTWGSLLRACEAHGNAELAEIAAGHLFEMEPSNSGNYVLLSNTYASLQKWDDAKRVRNLMIERGMRKSPGCSWLQ